MESLIIESPDIRTDENGARSRHFSRCVQSPLRFMRAHATTRSWNTARSTPTPTSTSCSPNSPLWPASDQSVRFCSHVDTRVFVRFVRERLVFGHIRVECVSGRGSHSNGPLVREEHGVGRSERGETASAANAANRWSWKHRDGQWSTHITRYIRTLLYKVDFIRDICYYTSGAVNERTWSQSLVVRMRTRV